MKNLLVVLISVSLLAISAQAVIVDGSLVTHLEADSLGLANGAAVSTWTDLSAAGNDALQGTAGSQPTYVATSAAFNGHASVQFDGTDDWMDMVDAVNVDSFTMFLVGKFNDTGFDQYFVSGQPGSGNGRLRFAEYGWSGYFRYRAGTSDYSSFDAPVSVGKDTATHLFAMDGISNGWIDTDALVNNPYSNTATDLAHLVMGAYDGSGTMRNFLNGEIAEVVLYNRTLSAAEVDQVNAELATKYSVPEPATMMLLGLGGLLLRRRKA